MRWPCLLALALLSGCYGPVDPASSVEADPMATEDDPGEAVEAGADSLVANETAEPSPAPAPADASPAAGNATPAAPPADIRMSGSKDLLLRGHVEMLRFDVPAGARSGYVNAWLQGMDTPAMGPGTSCFRARATALDGSFDSSWGDGRCSMALTMVPSATGEDGVRYGPKGLISWDAADMCACSFEVMLNAGPQANTLVWDVVIDYEPFAT